MNHYTILRMSGIGVPPYSARGLSQTLTPIGQASQLRRTVNGELVDLSDEAFRKYASVITGNDVDPPAMGNVWPGMVIEVDCIPELAVALEDTETTELPTELPTDAFDRVPVGGSERIADGFLFYRPRLTMVVMAFNWDKDEYGARGGWTLSLEEQ